MKNPDLDPSRKPAAFITGATGFIGGHLARRLAADGWQVHALSRSGLPVADGLSGVVGHVYDGTTESLVSCMSESRPDVVFHLASLFLAQHETKDVEALIRSNVLLGNQLLEAMRVTGSRYLVNTGTAWQHYESKPYNPVCLYAATKQAFEAILEYYAEACGIKAITLRLFDTYGPDDPRPKLFSLLKNSARQGKTLEMSAGEQLIDLVHVDDVVEAFVGAARRLQGGEVDRPECYAVSSGAPIPLKQLVEAYQELAPVKAAIQWGSRPYRFREVMVPWNSGRTLPGWTPRVELAEGLRQITR